jgi:hypothetical protein
MNAIYEFTSDSKEWFNGPLTLLFSPMYFNYQTNSICEEKVEQLAAKDS